MTPRRASLATTSDIFVWTQKWLEARGFPHQALYLCESTSALAKKELELHRGLPFFVHLAGQQTHGRGRGDHTWASPPMGTALLCTWTFQLQKIPQHLTAPLMGLQVYQAALKTWPQLPWSLKAPNDLYLKDKKVGGLLVEVVTKGAEPVLLVGFGFNVLAAPGHVPHAASLSHFLKNPLTSDIWFGFLDQLRERLSETANLSHIVELSSALRHDLAEALKRHPLFGDLQQVSPEGDLIFSDRTVDWYSL